MPSEQQQKQVRAVMSLAKLLDGRASGNEMSHAEAAAAKADNLLVVFGYSDDNMELRGFVSDEVGCYGGGSCTVDRRGLRTPWPIGDPLHEDEAREYFAREGLPSIEIRAFWHDERRGPVWTYGNSAAVFGEFTITEDGEPWCRGVVIDCSELTQGETNE